MAKYHRQFLGYVVLRQLYNGATWQSLKGWQVVSDVVDRRRAEVIKGCNHSIVPWRLAKRFKVTKAA